MVALAPINYGAGVAVDPVNPSQSLMSGMAVGQGLVDASQAAKNQAILRQQANADMAQKMAERDALVAFQQAPSQRAAADILLRFPALKDRVTGFMGQLDDVEKKERVSQMTEGTGFLISGDTKGAADAFRRSAEAYATAGRQKDADALLRLADQTETSPDAVRAQLQLQLEALDPEIGKRLLALEESKSKVAKEAQETREIGAKANTQIAEAAIKSEEALQARDEISARIGLTRAQAARLFAQTKNEADQLGLAREDLEFRKLKAREEVGSQLVNLPEPAQKRVIEAADASAKSGALADKADALADRFGKMAADGVVGGRLGMAAERVKGELGWEDTVTQARKEYDGIVAREVISSLPAGAASDKDIDMAKKPLPASTANPAIIESHLRGVAKLNRYDQAVQRATADYIGQNGGVGQARTNMVVGGVEVPAGSTYVEILDAIKRKALANEVANSAKKAAGGKRSGAGQVQP